MLFGAHVSAAGGISKAIDRIETVGGDAVQVFTQSPRMWKPTAHAPEELARFRNRREEAGIGSVLCHALYLVNLASRDEEIRAKSLESLRATMDTARSIGADAVVFHVGSHLGYGFEEALDVIEPSLRDLLEVTTDDLWLCMENTAGAGGTIGRSVAELAALCETLDGHPRLGVCIDSCHWWASGVDVSDPAALDAALVELDSRIGLERLRCLHVNDAAVPLGSNRDRHERVGLGTIGDGLATFLAQPAFQSLPAVVETWEDKGADTEDIRRLRELHQKGRKALGQRASSVTRANTRKPARSRGSS